uniref:Putative tick transposon n=1 Tax=Rhipicephalus microplus TaxID=6941 RepID=A0A6G4ZX93_RHIMP
MVYIGQTGRCLNDRLREHNNNVHNVVQGHLGIDCRDCGCVPVFERCEVLSKHNSQATREIIEAYQINKFDGKCVSCPSVVLLQKEIAYFDLFKLHMHLFLSPFNKRQEFC